jgi:ubiquinone/menaquinone biosynthesis C-methylase UbiE
VPPCPVATGPYGYKPPKGVDVLWAAVRACGELRFAEAESDARITAQGLPKVLEQAQKYLDRHGIANRYDFLPGDLHKVEFPAGKCDLATLGHIVHGDSEVAARQLFKRLQPWFKPGGRFAIIDMIPNDERSGPPVPLIFALNYVGAYRRGIT